MAVGFGHVLGHDVNEASLSAYEIMVSIGLAKGSIGTGLCVKWYSMTASVCEVRLGSLGY